jgi:hypothetical protein
MEAEKLINELQLSAEMILALLAGITPEEARFKFNPEAWSMLEVLCHLLDEERYDFRKRLDILLHRPGDKWEPIDPQGWVSSQKYNEQDLQNSITAFIAERQKSLEWLKSLKTPNFEQDALAPWGSPIKAGDMLAAWVAHDNLHIRQLVELRRAHIENITMPYQTGYAGDW